MRHWNLGLNDPQSLSLVADARLSNLDYTNDQIWELLLGRGDPAAIILQTTYGLRARNMRIFPQFTENHTTVWEPTQFETSPKVISFFPNYIKLHFSPFSGINIELEYWIPDCQTAAGRVRVINAGLNDRKINFELVGILNPTGLNGQVLAPKQIEAVNVLQGKTAELQPVIFITGGAKAINSPYPALSLDLNMLPGSTRQFTWVQVALPDPNESFKQARHIATKNWPAEIAKLKMVNSKQLEVFSGNPDWDAAFALGQKMANSLLYDGNQHLPNTSFVKTRLPDQGYSNLGNGGDYNHLWNGQNALDAWYLSQNLLPGSSEILEGLLLNFFQTQNENGLIDWKPGLAGQRSQMQSFPILATLAWKLFEQEENKDFLNIAYPYLLKYIYAWFDTSHDQDGDGIPEWDNSIQSGFDDNPIFVKYQTWAQGVDISLVENPDLCSYLYKECQTLIKIAKEINNNQDIEELERLSTRLLNAVEDSWDPRATSYRYWDRDSHISSKGKKLSQRIGSGKIQFDLEFEQPVRLQIRFDVGSDLALQTEVSVHGTLANGQHRVEKIDRQKIHWMPEFGIVTIEPLFSGLDFVQIDNLPDKGKVLVYQVDLRKQDQTLLTPIWAGIPNQERVNKIVKNKLSKNKKYHQKFGMPASITTLSREDAEIIKSVWLPWNVMMGEGLLAYGARDEAINLFQRIMNGIIDNLKRDHAFRKHHHAEKEKAMGERNSLIGLPPLGLFLNILGIRIHSPQKVSINDFNPFPQPVKLKYQGLIIKCESDNTLITFPNGESVRVDDPSPCQISMQ